MANHLHIFTAVSSLFGFFRTAYMSAVFNINLDTVKIFYDLMMPMLAERTSTVSDQLLEVKRVSEKMPMLK